MNIKSKYEMFDHDTTNHIRQISKKDSYTSLILTYIQDVYPESNKVLSMELALYLLRNK